MSFAIELHFDDQTNGGLTPVWSALQYITGIPCGVGVGIAPHVSLAVLPECPIGLEPRVRSLASSMAVFDLPLGSVECFPGGRGVSELLKDVGVANSPFYESDSWRPHCTVATDVPDELLPRVIATATSMQRPPIARVVGLCGVNYRPASLAFHVRIGAAGLSAAT